MQLSGAEFTAKYGSVFFKWINKSRCHHGFTYALGLNVDTVPFDPSGECRAGGLYFTNMVGLCEYEHCGYLLAKIIVPVDAQVVWIDCKTFKADKIIIETFKYKFNELETQLVWCMYGNRFRKYCGHSSSCDEPAKDITISGAHFTALFGNTFFSFIKRIDNLNLNLNVLPKPLFKIHYINAIFTSDSYSEELAKISIPDDARVICSGCSWCTDKFIIDTDQYKLDAQETRIVARTSPLAALRNTKNQTPELCIEAVRRDPPLALFYVRDQTPEICIEAVRRDPCALLSVREQTPEICIAAVQRCKRYPEAALKYVRKQTPEICIAAVRQNPFVLRIVKEQTPEICLAAVQQSGYMLQFVKEQTPEICLAAVQQYAEALEYVFPHLQTPEICLAAVRQNGMALQYVREQTHEICAAAVRQTTWASRYVNNTLSLKMYLAAAQQYVNAHSVTIAFFGCLAAYNICKILAIVKKSHQ